MSGRVVPTMNEATRKMIEDGIRNLDNQDSEESRLLRESFAKWDRITQPLRDAIDATERLTDRCLSIRINTR